MGKSRPVRKKPLKFEWLFCFQALKQYKIGRDYSVELTVHIPADSYTWFVIE